jgi:nucleotide-binding universal stress UspA family protein
MRVVPAQRCVVVGVDGSRNSLAALRRAAEEADRRHARLDVIQVISPDEQASPRLLWTIVRWLRLRSLVARAIPRAQHITTRLRIAYGRPPKVLPDAAAHAELLVIGAREHSERGNPLGGETVPAVLTSSPCEVLVCADHAPHRGDRPPGRYRGL